MKIRENFVKDILEEDYPSDYQSIYDNSYLIQYLDIKSKAIHGDSKTRRSLANIYAVYSILHFYCEDFFEQPKKYQKFDGYEYTKLFVFYRGLYGGSKLQNHALNSRLNGEFINKFKKNNVDSPIIINDGKYLIHPKYIIINNKDTAKTVCKIVEKYISLLYEKDHALTMVLEKISSYTVLNDKKDSIKELLSEDAEARIFEIISFAILKNHYKNIHVYFGYTREIIEEYKLELYKTGRTNANDGGIDFVMRPVGRFFQVTEVNNYDKYLLDMDKVMHFPISFVIKTNKLKKELLKELEDYIAEKASGMQILEERYHKAIEEIITINELKTWIDELDRNDINGILRDIDIYYRMEMNMDEDEIEE